MGVKPTGRPTIDSRKYVLTGRTRCADTFVTMIVDEHLDGIA